MIMSYEPDEGNMLVRMDKKLNHDFWAVLVPAFKEKKLDFEFRGCRVYVRKDKKKKKLRFFVTATDGVSSIKYEATSLQELALVARDLEREFLLKGEKWDENKKQEILKAYELRAQRLQEEKAAKMEE